FIVDGQAVAGRGGQGDRRVAEAARAVVGQYAQGVSAAIDHNQVVAAGAGEAARGEAHGLFQGADHRAVGRVEAIRAGACAEAIAPRERVTGVIEEHADVAAGLVGDHDVPQPVAVDVHEGQVRGRLRGGQRERSAEGAVGILEGNLYAAVQRVGHHDVG